MSKLGKKIIVDKSEITSFNLLKCYAIANGYDVELFKVKHFNISDMSVEDMFENLKHKIEDNYEYLHYIHVKKENKLIVSIYFDKYDLAGWVGEPYYEIWDGSETERYLATEEGEIEMLDELVKILKKQEN